MSSSGKIQKFYRNYRRLPREKTGCFFLVRHTKRKNTRYGGSAQEGKITDMKPISQFHEFSRFVVGYRKIFKVGGGEIGF